MLKSILDPYSSIWVNASAGTGKTTILIKRLLSLLVNNVDPKSIICITFTKAAAVEMQQRLNSELAKWTFLDQQNLTNILQEFTTTITKNKIIKARQLFAQMLDSENGLEIQTIHSFCQTLLTKLSFEAKLPFDFKVIDDSQILYLIDEIKRKGNLDNNSALALSIITGYSSEYEFNKILHELINQKQYFLALSKKYNHKQLHTLLTQKFHLNESNIDTLKYELVNKSPLNNIINILQSYQSSANANDSKFLTKLSNWNSLDIENKIRNINDYFALFLTLSGNKRNKIVTQKLSDKFPDLNEILIKEQVRVKIIFENIKIARIIKLSVSLFCLGSNFVYSLEQKKQKLGLVTYDDLVIRIKELLYNDILKDWILYKIDNQIDHILIDEAQDTSPMQWQIIDKISEDFFAGISAKDKARSIFVVGDEKQSIYSFQGANHHYFSEVNHYFDNKISNSGHNFIQVYLDNSYRSSQAILQLVDKIFNQPNFRPSITLNDNIIKHNCIKHDYYGAVEILDLVEENEQSELILAQNIASKIKQILLDNTIMNGYKIEPRDIMVLFRKRDSLFKNIINALQKYHIPILGFDRLNIIEHIGVKDLLSCLEFALMPEDDFNLANILRSPLINCNNEILHKICFDRKEPLFIHIAKLAQFDDAVMQKYKILQKIYKLRYKTPSIFFSYILNKLNGYQQLVARLGDDMIDYLEEFIDMVIQYEKENPANLQIFLTWIKKQKLDTKRTFNLNDNKVKLLTIHGAKGLQAKLVIMPDTVKIPNSRSGNDIFISNELLLYKTNINTSNHYLNKLQEKLKKEQYDEYLRLLYVALTRAEYYLIIAGCTNKQKTNELCWYNIVKDNISTLPNIKKNKSSIIYQTGNNRVTKNYCPKKTASSSELPSYFRTQPIKHNAQYTRLSPSFFTNKTYLLKSPLITHNNEYKRIIGILIHKILELAPKIAKKDLPDAIDIILSEIELKDINQTVIRQNILNLIKNNPSLINKNNAFYENKIIGYTSIEQKKFFLSGQIDKIIVNENEVMLIDFKSSSLSFDNINFSNQEYFLQMQLYKSLLKKAFPQHKISAKLIWIYKDQILEQELDKQL